MRIFLIVPYYLAWHYSRALKNYITIWFNFVVFVFSFFSIWSLLSTLFLPYKRLSERYKGGLDLEDFFGTIIVNLLMRIVGFILRFVLILIGLFFTFLTFTLGLLGFFVWLILPLLIPFLFFASLISIFQT